tara:strand:+ start:757 stop:1056 length:300 start_codon:yes stop_codon:yes gene_type:complete
MSARKRQVGGNHYKDFEIQPFDFIEQNKLSYGVGNVIKYVCRWRKSSGGIEDLRKARHYIDLLIELELDPDKKDSLSGLQVVEVGDITISSAELTDRLT